jgi:hypothetical protein
MNEMTYDFLGLNDSEVVTIQSALLRLRINYMIERKPEDVQFVYSLIEKIDKVYYR